MKILGKNVAGFVSYDRHRVIDSILKSPEAAEIFRELEEKKKQPITLSQKKAREILLELSSSYNSSALKLCYWIVRVLKKLMFKGALTYGDEVKTIESLTSQGKIIFYLPNHKSHMDYLLLSYTLFNHGIAPPHIAAGVNLSFFPVGWLFRNTGAYFIRRKIAGNFLYTKFLQLYFDWMLKEKISQEFYMEGGRSRDGKIRDPQSGIFTLFVEQIQARNMMSEVYLVPTAITYDRLPEMKGILNELKGGEKEKESAFSLLSSLSMLWTNHHNMHVQFGKPVALESVLSGELTKQKFHDLSQDVFSKVQQQKTVTVSSLVALVLLSATQSIPEKSVYDRVLWLMNFLKPCRQCISEELANIQKDWSPILERFEKQGWFHRIGAELHIQASKRLEMNYYKNDLFPVLRPFYSFADEQLQYILTHEFPYSKSKTWSFRMDDDDRKFLKQVSQPLESFYKEVSNLIQTDNIQNIMNKEVQRTMLIKLKMNKDFAYPEMHNTEALRSACAFFHQKN
ncbi:MAG: glycerol-3-phosphate acyltransferase [Proteobacteria bacterium]|nr:glycerol-3-phosphate acyltransferase [Pseudomonadota bacterium]